MMPFAYRYLYAMFLFFILFYTVLTGETAGGEEPFAVLTKSFGEFIVV